jgi:hypothetical protein
MPCGRSGGDAAWLRLAVLTHNVLIGLRRFALPRRGCERASSGPGFSSSSHQRRSAITLDNCCSKSAGARSACQVGILVMERCRPRLVWRTCGRIIGRCLEADATAVFTARSIMGPGADCRLHWHSSHDHFALRPAPTFTRKHSPPSRTTPCPDSPLGSADHRPAHLEKPSPRIGQRVLSSWYRRDRFCVLANAVGSGRSTRRGLRVHASNRSEWALCKLWQRRGS